MRYLKTFLNWIYFLVLVGVLLIVGGALLIFIVLYFFSLDLPDHTQLREYSPNLITRVFSNDGKLIAEYALERRIFLPIKCIPHKVKNAFLAAEDKGFYKHFGIDPIGIIRATLINVMHAPTRKRLVGASTITQQVAKLFFTGNEVSYKRKIKEAILSFRLEHTLGKDKIFELYLNQLYLGNGSYGVAAASQYYFNKSLEELSIAECSYLAALAKGANNYHPIKHKKKALERRNWVIDRQVYAGFITKDDGEIAKQEDLVTTINKPISKDLQQSYFVEEVRRLLAKKFSYNELYKGGLIVRTTQDTKLQKLAEESLRKGLIRLDREQIDYKGPIANISDDLSRIKEFSAPAAFKVAVITEVLENGTVRLLTKDSEVVDIPLSENSWIIKKQISEKLAPGLVVSIPKGKWDPISIEIYKKSNGQSLNIGLGNDSYLKKLKTDKKHILGYIIQSFPAPVVIVNVRGKVYKISINELSKFVADEIKNRLRTGDVVYIAKIDDQYSIVQLPETQGSILALDPETGNILALNGGFDFSVSEFDRSIQSKPQIGSLIKPFVYMAALNRGMCPATKINARYIAVDMGPLGIWEPKNYNMEEFEDITLRDALERSINTATVRIARYAGLDEISKIIKIFGILDETPKNISFVLGACNASALNIAKAYSIIANGGKNIEPHIIDMVQNKYGKTIYKNSYNICNGCIALGKNANRPPIIIEDSQQVINPAIIYQMQSMLEGVIKHGSGRRARNIHYSVAGKTGTSNDNRVAWFVGFTPDIVVVIFVARDDGRSLGDRASGSSTALPIFIDFINKYIKGKLPRPFKVPDSIRTQNIILDDGKNIYEIFKDGDDIDFLPEPDNVNFKEIDPDFYYTIRQFKKLYQ